MARRIHCPACQANLKVEENTSAHTLVCPKCRTNFRPSEVGADSSPESRSSTDSVEQTPRPASAANTESSAKAARDPRAARSGGNPTRADRPGITSQAPPVLPRIRVEEPGNAVRQGLPGWTIYAFGAAAIGALLFLIWLATAPKPTSKIRADSSGPLVAAQSPKPETHSSPTADEEPAQQPSAVVRKPLRKLRAVAAQKEEIQSSGAQPSPRQLPARPIDPGSEPPLSGSQTASAPKADVAKIDTPAKAAPVQSSPSNSDLAEILPEKIDDAIATILDEFQPAAAQFAVEKVKTTDVAKLKLLLKRDPAKAFGARLLEVGEKKPNSKTAFQAFVAALYIVRDADAALTSEIVERATKHLIADSLTEPGLGKVALLVASFPHRGARRLLESALDKSTHRDIRGLACFALIKNLQCERDQTADRIGLSRIDKQMAKLTRRIDQHEFGNVTLDDLPLADAVKTLLAHKEQLSSGSMAPEIVGKDLDGSRFKLSDYRGKVVMLEFWANWCPYCRRLFPYERDLVSKLQDRPFALLGVNVDKRPDVAAIQRKKITSWRSWQDGPGGPIGAKWHIKGYPTVFILDHKGTIRFAGYTADASFYSKVIEALLTEAEPKNVSMSEGGGAAR